MEGYIGATLYGFCNGYFGRDSYRDKVIIAMGVRWIVVKYEGEDQFDFCEFDSRDQMIELIEKWMKVDQED